MSLADDLINLEAGQTVRTSGDPDGGTTTEVISGGSSSSFGGSSSGGSSGAGGFSVPEEFRMDENYGPTSTGQNGGSESPPDNGGYTNPPRRPDRTGDGSSSAGSDPVSSGELDPAAAADEPTFSTEDPLVGIGEQVEEQTGGSVSVNDFLDSVLKAGGTFTTGVGGSTEGRDLTDFNIPDALTGATGALQNFPMAVTPESVNDPVSDSGPQWLTVGVAAVAAAAGAVLLSRRQS